MESPRGDHAVPSWVALVVQNLLLGVAYVVAGKISLLLKHPLGGISPLWLPSAVALAGLMRYGLRALPGVVAASMLGSLWNGYSLASASTGTLAATVEVLLAHTMLRERRVTLTNLLDGVRPMWRFVLAVLCAAMVGASLGVAGLLLTGTMSGGLAVGLALWFAGDFVGMLLMVPLVAAVIESGAARRTGDTAGSVAASGAHRNAWRDAKRYAWIPMALAVASTLVIFFLTDQTREGHHVFGYLVFPFVVWTALVASSPAATFTHALVGGLSVVGTALGLGPYAVTASPTDVGLLQTFVVAVIGTSLFLKAAMQDRRRTLDRLRHQATHDELTGLPNRRGMHQALDRLLAQARHERSSMGVLFVDLDDFNVVNDAAGHDAGDQVLVEIASRLRRVVQPGEVISRAGGDEFVVASPQRLEPLNGLAERIVEAVREPVHVDVRQFRLTCSVGIARYPEDADDTASLMRFADIAMYRAKVSGKNAYTHFTPEIMARRMARVDLETALRGAVARGDFSLHYQPQVDMTTRRLVGAEVLLRWRDDTLGSVSPGVFVPVSEDIGLVNQIGQWVIDNVCAQLRRWIDAGHKPPRLAVNLSPMQLGPELAASWRRAIDDARLPSDLLEAELTESCVMRDERASVVALEDLSRQGIHISLDDFGTGQSSLSLLTRLPLDTVKIDQSFIHQVGEAEGAQVVTAVVTLAHRLGLRCLAEGVETEAQEGFLRDIGCDAYQGFLLSRPLPPAQFEQRFLVRDADVVRHVH